MATVSRHGPRQKALTHTAVDQNILNKIRDLTPEKSRKHTREKASPELDNDMSSLSHISVLGQNETSNTLPSHSPATPESLGNEISTGIKDSGVRSPPLNPLSATEAHQRSRQRSIPDNTIEGALGSLEDDQWLSTTCIELLFRMLPCAADAKVYDGSFIRVDEPESMRDKRSRGDHRLRLLPINHRDSHWTLLVMDRSTAKIEFYDSLPGCKNKQEAQNAIKCWTDPLPGLDKGRLTDIEWSFNVENCPAQRNDSDCGISTIVCALYRVLELPLPPNIDFALWRRLLRAVLAVSQADYQHRANPQATPAKAASEAKSRETSHRDSLALAQDFRIRKDEHELAQFKVTFATNIRDTISTLLDQIQAQLTASRRERDIDPHSL